MPFWNRTKTSSSPSSSASLSPREEEPPTSKPPTSTEKDYLQAAHVGNLEKVKECFKSGIDKDAKNNLGWTALHKASDNGQLVMVQYLTATCHVDKDAKTNLGSTALHRASWKGHLEIVTYLIETCHVDKEVKDSDGRTALHCASLYGHLEIVTYLIETCQVDKEAKDIYGWTALHSACLYGRLVIVQYLIERCQVDKEAKANDGWTSLHYASHNGHLEIAEYLIDACHVEKEAKNKNGQSAYDIAMANNKSEIVQYLQNVRSTSASATSAHPRGEEPISKPTPVVKEFLDAARDGNLVTIKYCVNNGIDKDTKDNDGWTALHFATWKGHLEIVQYFVEKCQAAKEAKDNGGNTALHIASRNDRLDIVTYLIETCGVNKELRNNVGQTAYDIAIAKNKKGDVAQYLLTVSDDTAGVNDSNNVSTVSLENAPVDQINNSTATPFTSSDHPQSSIVDFGAADPNPLVLTSASGKTSAFELNEAWILSLQNENHSIVSRLSQLDGSLQFIDERRNLLDLIVVEKCMTIEEQDEQSAILACPKHRDFYLLLQRKLKCMIKSCETLSTGMVNVGGGDMRAFCAKTISEHDYNIFKETKVGFLIANAVQWSKQNLAFIPFVDTIGSVFQVIVTLKDERDRYVGLARVADFATMACLPHYGAISLDATIEKVARHFVRARVGSPYCKFVEKRDQLGKLKQLMINLLADSGSTPAKEQASKAADCAFAHIMKPSKHSVLLNVLNDTVLDVGLAEALAATILGISVHDLKQLDPISTSPPADTIQPPPTDTPCDHVPYANVSNVVLSGTSVSTTISFHSGAYASSDVVAELAAKLQKQEEMNQMQAELIRKQNITIQQHEELQSQLRKDIEYLKKKIKDSISEHTSEGGLAFADKYKENKDDVQNLRTAVNYLRDRQMMTEGSMTNYAELLEDLRGDMDQHMELTWQQMNRRQKVQFLRQQEEKKKRWENGKEEQLQTRIVDDDNRIQELKIVSKGVWSRGEDEGADENKMSD